MSVHQEARQKTVLAVSWAVDVALKLSVGLGSARRVGTILRRALAVDVAFDCRF